jgi:hypothetical protein
MSRDDHDPYAHPYFAGQHEQYGDAIDPDRLIYGLAEAFDGAFPPSFAPFPTDDLNLGHFSIAGPTFNTLFNPQVQPTFVSTPQSNVPWPAPTLPSNELPLVTSEPGYFNCSPPPPLHHNHSAPQFLPHAGLSMGYLSPNEASTTRSTRSVSNASSIRSYASSIHSDTRSLSPNVSEMSKWGTKTANGSWRCDWPGCKSPSTFIRGCDLRKHYKRHSKAFFCKVAGCPHATEGGFSSRKDRARHEQKHNPTIACEWESCTRMFSRVDNMVRMRCSAQMKTCTDVRPERPRSQGAWPTSGLMTFD